jgi:hypothetical protein
MKISNHQIWLEAHLALGKLEQSLGQVLSDIERGNFIRAFIADYRAANPDKIDP